MSRRIYSDASGRVEPFSYAEDEICLVLSDAARVALLKVIGKSKPNELAAKGLIEPEQEAIDSLYHMLT